MCGARPHIGFRWLSKLVVAESGDTKRVSCIAQNIQNSRRVLSREPVFKPKIWHEDSVKKARAGGRGGKGNEKKKT